MPQIRWEFIWQFRSPLHLGTGLSQPGFADRIIRRNGRGEIEMAGDAVKGAIRLSAERLVGWSGVSQPAENDEDSELRHPALKRIFVNADGRRFRFQPAIAAVHTFRSASTAIEESTGTAKHDTLRIVENVASGSEFNVVITADGPGVSDADVELLTVSILLTAAIGGRRTAGLGQLECKNLTIKGAPPPNAREWAARTIKYIKETPCIG